MSEISKIIDSSMGLDIRKISPNGATDFSQGIHPLDNRIKKNT